MIKSKINEVVFNVNKIVLGNMCLLTSSRY